VKIVATTAADLIRTTETGVQEVGEDLNGLGCGDPEILKIITAALAETERIGETPSDAVTAGLPTR